MEQQKSILSSQVAEKSRTPLWNIILTNFHYSVIEWVREEKNKEWMLVSAMRNRTVGNFKAMMEEREVSQ